MKICKLHFKNLNSLAGEWTVDLESPEFNSGLFAITGPTGSGKTTILDAICLALYGRTPRLGGVTGSKNEIMTRDTNECFSSVTFEVGKNRYEAVWSQKRTKSGNLKPWEYAFSRIAPDEKVFSGTAGDRLKQVAAICRLDFKQFTQTVILPQGEFAKFMKGEVDERALMLEKLTGAEIYREISQKVYERAQKEEQALAEKKAEMSGYRLLSDEERTAIDARAKVFEVQKARLEKIKKEIDNAIDWYKQVEKLEIERRNLEEDEVTHERKEKQFAPLAEKLAKHERAAKAVDLHKSLVAKRTKCEELRSDQTKFTKRAQTAATEQERATRALVAASEELSTAEKENDELEEVLKKVRLLDKDKGDLEKNREKFAKSVEELERSLEKISKEERKKKDELLEAQERRGELEKTVSAADDEYKLAADELRLNDLSALAAKLQEGAPCPLCGAVHHPEPYKGGSDAEEISRKKRDTAEAKLTEAKDALSAHNEGLSGLDKKCASLKQELKGLEKQLEEKKKDLRGADGELAAVVRERQQLFGDKDTEQESQNSKKRLRAAKDAVRKCQGEKETAANNVSEYAGQLNRIAQSIKSETTELEALGSEFRERLMRLGFADESLWNADLLSDKEATEIRTGAEELDNEKGALGNRRSQLEGMEKVLPSKPERERDGLEAAQESTNKEYDGLIAAHGADEQALGNDKRNRELVERLNKEYQHQEKVVALWKRLNAQIGQKNGDKFVKYVQSLTFRRLADAANGQLKLLSERYRLKMSEEDALSFDVVDRWRGGEVRSSANLSGGETFIVSLALALALSHGMKEIKVDSLFLDEGFGTLDDETLGTVLDCLAHLRENGKLVGIISHVERLKDCIDCRLVLKSDSQGRSTLSGPGCSRGSS